MSPRLTQHISQTLVLEGAQNEGQPWPIRTMKANVATDVETNVGLMFWARCPAGGPVGPGSGGELGQPRPNPAGPEAARLDPAWFR